jgi:hypothetical protein
MSVTETFGNNSIWFFAALQRALLVWMKESVAKPKCKLEGSLWDSLHHSAMHFGVCHPLPGPDQVPSSVKRKARSLLLVKEACLAQRRT